MRDRNDFWPVRGDVEEHRVRESIQYNSPIASVCCPSRVALGGLANGSQSEIDGAKELEAKARPFFLVPVDGLRKLYLRRRK